MKKRKVKIGKAGLTGVEIVIIGAIAVLTIILTALVPIVSLKTHVVRVVEIQYGYSNAELALLTLLSDRKIYRDLSLYVADMGDSSKGGFSRGGTEALVKSRLNQLVPSECYNLSYSGGTILSQKLSEKRCETEYSASAYVVLPYGESIMEEITLEISTARPIMPTPPTEYCCYNTLTLEPKCATEEECTDGWEIEYVECDIPVIDCPPE